VLDSRSILGDDRFVMDEDIGVLVRGRGHMLESLKLKKCTGFSTDGLVLIARSFR